MAHQLSKNFVPNKGGGRGGGGGGQQQGIT